MPEIVTKKYVSCLNGLIKYMRLSKQVNNINVYHVEGPVHNLW